MSADDARVAGAAAGVVVAVVTHNSADDLPGLLASLPAATEGVPGWLLVVADNSSADGSAELVERLAPEATVVRTGGNLGYAAGVNVCAAHAGPDDALLVLNADVRLHPGALAALLGAAVDESVGIVVPVVEHPDGSPEATLRRRPTVLRAWGETVLGARASRVPGGHLGAEVQGPPPGAGDHRDVDWANGAVLLVAPRARATVGHWRDDLFLYGEEVDYCLRVGRAGLRVRQVGSARAVHKGGDVTRSPALWAQLVTNRVVHAATWDGRAAAVAVWLALVTAQVARLPLRRGIHRRALRELLVGAPRLLRGEPTHPAAPATVGQRS